MNKAKLKYVKYTKKELDQYVRDKNSCISMHTSDMHVGFPPWGFANFQETLTNIISRDKIGKYDTKLEGIVLDVRNIKVFGTSYPVQDDDPINHINIKANFYVFQPRIGALIKGVVKHISHGHIAVIIYRVFNVSIRFNRENVRDSLQINQQISFRIKKFDLSGAMPYIEGEFIGVDAPKTQPKTGPTLNKHSRFDDNEAGTSGGDSGISTEETNTSILKNKVALKKEKASKRSSEESSSSEESDSDDDSDENSKANIVDQFLQGINVKKEELSDSEDEFPVNKSSALNATAKPQEDSSDESSSEESTSEDDSEDEHTKQSITLKNIKKESASSSDSSSTDSESSDSSESSNEPVKNKFKPITIKEEPMSDIEEGKFKKPSTDYRRNLNVSQNNGTSEKNKTRRRTTSVSDQLDSLMSEMMGTKEKDKRKSLPSKKIKLNDQSMDFGNLSAFPSPALSSTLKPTSSKLKRKMDLISPSKIKHELDSEDEIIKKIKQNGKTGKLK